MFALKLSDHLTLHYDFMSRKCGLRNCSIFLYQEQQLNLSVLSNAHGFQSWYKGPYGKAIIFFLNFFFGGRRHTVFCAQGQKKPLLLIGRYVGFGVDKFITWRIPFTIFYEFYILNCKNWKALGLLSFNFKSCLSSAFWYLFLQLHFCEEHTKLFYQKIQVYKHVYSAFFFKKIPFTWVLVSGIS